MWRTGSRRGRARVQAPWDHWHPGAGGIVSAVGHAMAIEDDLAPGLLVERKHLKTNATTVVAIDPKVSFWSRQIESFAARWSGSMLIQERGEYTLQLSSIGGAELVLDGHVLLPHHGTAGTQQHNCTVVLEAGYHDMNLMYEETSGEAGLTLEYAGPDNGNSLDVVPSSVLFHRKGPCALWVWNARDPPCKDRWALASGDSCDLHCASGYFVGPSKATTQEVTCDKGELFPQGFSCSGLPCEVPKIANTSEPRCAEGDLLHDGANCTPACWPGFLPRVDGSLHCHNGTLEGVWHDCHIPAPCHLEAESIDHGEAELCQGGNMVPSGSRCVAQCEAGYTPSRSFLDCVDGSFLPAGGNDASGNVGEPGEESFRCIPSGISQAGSSGTAIASTPTPTPRPTPAPTPAPTVATPVLPVGPNQDAPRLQPPPKDEQRRHGVASIFGGNMQATTLISSTITTTPGGVSAWAAGAEAKLNAASSAVQGEVSALESGESNVTAAGELVEEAEALPLWAWVAVLMVLFVWGCFFFFCLRYCFRCCCRRKEAKARKRGLALSTHETYAEDSDAEEAASEAGWHPREAADLWHPPNVAQTQVPLRLHDGAPLPPSHSSMSTVPPTQSVHVLEEDEEDEEDDSEEEEEERNPLIAVCGSREGNERILAANIRRGAAAHRPPPEVQVPHRGPPAWAMEQGIRPPVPLPGYPGSDVGRRAHSTVAWCDVRVTD